MSVHVGSPREQGTKAAVLSLQPAAGGFDAGHLPTNRGLTIVAVPEFDGQHDLFVLCANGHPPIATLPLGQDDPKVCPVCQAIRDGRRHLDRFADKAAVRGYERLD